MILKSGTVVRLGVHGCAVWGILGFGVPYFNTFFLNETKMKYKFVLFSPWLLKSPGYKMFEPL